MSMHPFGNYEAYYECNKGSCRRTPAIFCIYIYIYIMYLWEQIHYRTIHVNIRECMLINANLSNRSNSYEMKANKCELLMSLTLWGKSNCDDSHYTTCMRHTLNPKSPFDTTLRYIILHYSNKEKVWNYSTWTYFWEHSPPGPGTLAANPTEHSWIACETVVQYERDMHPWIRGRAIESQN